MPREFWNKPNIPRGVAGRNSGLQWIVDHADPAGVFYFADDDNAYHQKLFQEV